MRVLFRIERDVIVVSACDRLVGSVGGSDSLSPKATKKTHPREGSTQSRGCPPPPSRGRRHTSILHFKELPTGPEVQNPD
jgi:hypothetical protein